MYDLKGYCGPTLDVHVDTVLILIARVCYRLIKFLNFCGMNSAVSSRQPVLKKEVG